jgi:hypothetical protein
MIVVMIFSLLSLFWKNRSRFMLSLSCLCVSVSPASSFECLNQFYETWYVYHGTWAPLSDILHKSLPSVCVSVCVSPVVLLHSGSVYMFLQQRIRETKMNCWTHHFPCGPRHMKGESVVCLYVPLSFQGNGSVNTFPQQWRIVGGIIFYMFCVMLKELRRLVLPRTSCSFNDEDSHNSDQENGSEDGTELTL